MIKSRSELYEYIEADRRANSRDTSRARIFGDEIWKFQKILRKLDYYSFRKRNALLMPIYMIYKMLFHKLSIKLGFTIPFNRIGKGFSIAHYGTIVIAKEAEIGENFRCHEGVNIGSTNGNSSAPRIGNNVFVGSGAKILGDITVANGVCIGAGAVVVHSIVEENTTWAGVPAKKISDNSSTANLSKMLF